MLTRNAMTDIHHGGVRLAWTHHSAPPFSRDIPCAIMVAEIDSACGYVRLPQSIRRRVHTSGDLPHRLSRRAGVAVNYLNSRGWVGFDTFGNHHWWPPAERAALGMTSFADIATEHGMTLPRGMGDESKSTNPDVRTWSFDQLVTTTTLLAELVGNLARPGAMTAAKKRPRPFVTDAQFARMLAYLCALNTQDPELEGETR